MARRKRSRPQRAEGGGNECRAFAYVAPRDLLAKGGDHDQPASHRDASTELVLLTDASSSSPKRPRLSPSPPPELRRLMTRASLDPRSPSDSTSVILPMTRESLGSDIPIGQLSISFAEPGDAETSLYLERHRLHLVWTSSTGEYFLAVEVSDHRDYYLPVSVTPPLESVKTIRALSCLVRSKLVRLVLSRVDNGTKEGDGSTTHGRALCCAVVASEVLCVCETADPSECPKKSTNSDSCRDLVAGLYPALFCSAQPTGSNSEGTTAPACSYYKPTHVL